MRGNVSQLPNELIEFGKEHYFLEFTNDELRFLPYLQYLAINSQKLDPNKINTKEREIYSKLKKLEVISGGASEQIIFIDKQFYDFVCDCLFYAYNGQ